MSARPPSSTANRDELEPEATPACLLQDVHVREVRDGVAVGDDAREPELAAAVAVAYEADDARRVGDQLVHQLARAPLGPVARRDEGVHGGPVDPGRVVVEHVSHR